MAACALRAAGRSSGHPRPAAFSCHYLGTARFGIVDLLVETRKQGRTASSQRVEVSQVWSVEDEVEGLEHDDTVAPAVPGPDDLASIEELLTEETKRPYPFWENFEAKPVTFESKWPPAESRPPCWQEWLRFRPSATFDDPWVDAARSLILVDLPSWPAAHRRHAWREPAFIAPTLDLNVAFHLRPSGEEWLHCTHPVVGSVSTDG